MSRTKFLLPFLLVSFMGIVSVQAQEEYIDDTIPPALLIDESDLEEPEPEPIVQDVDNQQAAEEDQKVAAEAEKKAFELSIDDLLGSDLSQNSDIVDDISDEAQPGMVLERTRKELEEEARVKAYEMAIQSLLPLRPEEIRGLLEKFDRTQESVKTPVYPMPQAKMVVQNISLDPGTTPSVINLALGHVTTVSVLDITGATWPIEDISWAGEFDITESSAGEGSHIVRITPRTEYSFGNMSMRLLGLDTPIIISMQTNRDLVHYRFDAVIPERGPNAKTPLMSNIATTTAQAGTEELSNVLQGIIPPGAKRLNVSGTDGRTSAYNLAGLTYVRTPLTLLSPSWSNSVASADGMRVYTVKDSPMLLLSDAGKVLRVRLSKREELLQ